MSASIKSLVAGALYSFAAHLTARPGVERYGANVNASPMAERVVEFLRKHDIGDDIEPTFGWETRLQERGPERLKVKPPFSVTLQDALRQLDSHDDGDFRKIDQFLEGLLGLMYPRWSAAVRSPVEAAMLEGAYQSGFHFIDDDSRLLVVHEDDLVSFVSARQALYYSNGRSISQGEPDEDGEAWRFMMRSVKPGPEQEIMDALAIRLDIDLGGDEGPDHLDALIREGMAEFKALGSAT